MVFAVVSLITLVLVIVIGFFTKKNMGIIAIAAALILGRIGGLADNNVISSYPLSLFINLSGIFFFFSIAECNGVLQLMAKKVIIKLPKSQRLYPIFVFIISALLTLLDTGGMAIYSFAPMITMSIGAFLGVNTLMVGIITIFGTCIGVFSPIGMVGIAIRDMAAGSGYENVSLPILGCAAIGFTVMMLLVYIVFGGFRKKKLAEDGTNISGMDLTTEKFDRNQKLILAMIVVLIVVVMVWGLNPGLAAYLCGCILLLLNAADEKEVFKRIPWGQILMITGFGTLMGVTSALGGVDLLAQGFSHIANRYTAAPVMGFTSSIMSLFSFALAGPIPALIPTVGTVSAAVGGAVKEIEMISSICIGGFGASISPFSLGGAIILSAYMQIEKPDAKGRAKITNKLLICALLSSLILAVISGTGIYGIFSN